MRSSWAGSGQGRRRHVQKTFQRESFYRMIGWRGCWASRGSVCVSVWGGLIG